MTRIGFPYRMDRSGVTARVDEDQHIRDLIEQVLFTSPGERVNRPSFGSGLQNLIFAPGSNELAAATQFLVHGALQQTLGDLILVESVEASSQEGVLLVVVRYSIKKTKAQRADEFRRSI
ncbi:MAG: GPW/gp25 family protein [Fimbriimonas sp.]